MRLDSERLILREFDAADLEPLAAILSDPRVMEYSSAGPMGVAAVRDFLESCCHSYCAHGFGQWAVVERDSGRLLGFCGISPVRLDERDEVQLAYRLAADCWGEGLASEAGAAVLTAAFDRFGLASVVARRRARSLAPGRREAGPGPRLRHRLPRVGGHRPSPRQGCRACIRRHRTEVIRLHDLSPIAPAV